MEYEDKDLLKDLELGLDGTCLPIEIDNRSASTNAENCPKEKEEKIVEDFEGLGGNEIPAFSIMENHAEDRHVEYVEGKVNTSNDVSPSILNHRSDFKHCLFGQAYPLHHGLMDTLLQ